MNAPVHAIPVDIERQRLVCAALRAFMPEHSVLFAGEDVTPYECDGLSAYRQVPMVVALPENEEQVCAMALPARKRMPANPQIILFSTVHLPIEASMDWL